MTINVKRSKIMQVGKTEEEIESKLLATRKSLNKCLAMNICWELSLSRIGK
jgi:hypothetical protein